MSSGFSQPDHVVAFDLETQAIKWNVEVGKAPAGALMLPEWSRTRTVVTGSFLPGSPTPSV